MNVPRVLSKLTSNQPEKVRKNDFVTVIRKCVFSNRWSVPSSSWPLLNIDLRDLGSRNEVEIVMKCRDLQFELPLYLDDVLAPSEMAAIDAHLDTCPVCRQKLADMREIRSAMRSLPRPQITAARMASIRNAVAERITPHTISPGFALLETPKRWLDVWLMPYTVGAVGSVVLAISFLWLILSPANIPDLAAVPVAGTPIDRSGSIFLAENNDPLLLDLSPSQYAYTRLGFSSESPSVNPRGALVALTRSLLRGEMMDEEVVVVADVFGNGLARIAEVVEPSDDRKAIERLQRALQTDPDYAPFVPADLDGRSDTMRVVLKIQSVNVDAEPAQRRYY